MRAENRHKCKHHSLHAIPDRSAIELFLYKVNVADQFSTTLNCQTPDLNGILEISGMLLFRYFSYLCIPQQNGKSHIYTTE